MNNDINSSPTYSIATSTIDIAMAGVSMANTILSTNYHTSAMHGMNQGQMMNGRHGMTDAQQGIAAMANFQGAYTQTENAMAGNKFVNSTTMVLGNIQMNTAGQQILHPGAMHTHECYSVSCGGR